ncbi:hypothetical protein [Microbulbifer spongiae]|uniref:Uncharacterized protein n=1 Tax=Microbulbifer spongiae TaxID=2944933 RepID=A0ABY9EAJ9_9GAMM|nr:hypothetical protein [Microbulbifer sp. MI-G]WKD48395.1 hypothetical protein M8T91_10670 [Microbulbifer sp. MI-G]
MKEKPIYPTALTIALSAVALGILMLAGVVKQSESGWVFLSTFLVANLSLWLSRKKKGS